MLMTRERVKSSDKIFDRILPFHEPKFRTVEKLMENYARGITDAGGLATEIQKFLSSAYPQKVLMPAGAPIADADVALLSYEDALSRLKQYHEAYVSRISAMFRSPYIGTINWLTDDVCRFTFVTARKESGIFQRLYHRTQHLHDIVHARSWPPSECNKLDARAKQLLPMIPKRIAPYVRVITGLEIVKGQGFAGTDSELTAIGRFVEGSKDAAVAAGKATAHAAVVAGGVALEVGKAAAIGAGVLAGGALAVAGVVAAGAALAAAGAAAIPLAFGAGLVQAIIADPALVIGEHVLHGWEE